MNLDISPKMLPIVENCFSVAGTDNKSFANEGQYECSPCW